MRNNYNEYEIKINIYYVYREIRVRETILCDSLLYLVASAVSIVRFFISGFLLLF